MTTSALRFVALAICAFVVACGDSEEYAHFHIESGAELPDCPGEVFPFEPTFLSAKTHQGRTGILLQSARDVHYRSDMALIQLYEPELPDDGRVELASASDPEATARGKMAFFSSCPHELETLELRGTVEFERLDPDEAVAGRLIDGYAVDARTQETKINSLSGSWQVPVRKGVPYQDFFALPESEQH